MKQQSNRKKSGVLIVQCAALLLALLSGCAVPQVQPLPESETQEVSSALQGDTVSQSEPEENNATAESSSERTLEEKIEVWFADGADFSVGEDEAVFLGSVFQVREQNGTAVRGYTYSRVQVEDNLAIYFCSADQEKGYIAREKSAFVAIKCGEEWQQAAYYDNSDIYRQNWEHMNEDGPPEGTIRAYEHWDAATQTYTRFWDRSDLEFKVDAAAGKIHWSYNIQPQNLTEVLVHSPCGRYDIYEAGTIRAGDGFSASIVLVDNETGGIRWLSNRGSRYSDYGFFANGDLYVREPDCLRIFSKESGYTQEYPFEMSFGRQPEGINRVLCAVRRDPVDRTYLVVYFEQTMQQAQERWTNPTQTDVCFVVGKCDQNGRLLQTWKSEQMVVSPMYDTSMVDLWVRENTAYINVFQKSFAPVFSFTMDLESGSFTYLDDEWQTPETEPFRDGPVYTVTGTVQAWLSSSYGVELRANAQAQAVRWHEQNIARSGGSVAVIGAPYDEAASIDGVGCVALLQHEDGSTAAAFAPQDLTKEMLCPPEEGYVDHKLDDVWINASTRKMYWICEHNQKMLVADFNAGTITVQPYSR